MARLTYAQVRSAASALVKEKYAETKSTLDVLIYKDSGGNFNKKILRDGTHVCYIELKAIVRIDSDGHEKEVGSVCQCTSCNDLRLPRTQVSFEGRIGAWC